MDNKSREALEWTLKESIQIAIMHKKWDCVEVMMEYPFLFTKELIKQAEEALNGEKLKNKQSDSLHQKIYEMNEGFSSSEKKPSIESSNEGIYKKFLSITLPKTKDSNANPKPEVNQLDNNDNKKNPKP